MSWWLRLAQRCGCTAGRSTEGVCLRFGSWGVVRGLTREAAAIRTKDWADIDISAMAGIDFASPDSVRSHAKGVVRMLPKPATVDDWAAARSVGGREPILVLLEGVATALGTEVCELMESGSDDQAAARLTFLVADVLDCHDDLSGQWLRSRYPIRPMSSRR